ncbi:LacI family DNA-binding transcriptional regulator [Microlunatus flavus]|uniref:LacI family transcriptional regulator n=1 Tax=Microlunatus flavus TaxID=1036181 RepID=A0A1H9C7U4_9ACTN|nr:LacI family DNA-binding transcriptional regulator [Microlunatus flavus]SEP96873.1 LacI family transcriptional regulator [Microlunatus flavus]
MVTSHDVARLAGVSQPTVSRALRDSPKVSALTRKKVRDAANALGYVPSDTGRALSVGRTHRVGLLVTDLTNQFYTHTIAPMHHALEALGYQLVLLTEEGDSDRVADRLLSTSLDGALLATTATDSLLPVRLRDRGLPFVYFNRRATTVEADSVEVEARSGMRELTERVLDLGHRRIGAVLGPVNASTASNRELVLRERLALRGLELPEELAQRGGFDFETGFSGAKHLLELDEPPTVIVCANDVVAYGAFNAARSLGRDVPGEVSIVGFDDLPETRWPLLQITTVAFDLEAMARRGAALLVDRMRAGASEPYRHEWFPSHLVERATLGPVPANAP